MSNKTNSNQYKLRSAQKARQEAKKTADPDKSVSLKQTAEKLEADARDGKAVAPDEDPLLGV